MPADLAGLVANVTGAGGIGSDYLAAIVAGTDSTTLVTVLLVIVILLVIYRAPLAAMIPLVTIGAAFVVARGALGVLALMGWQISSLIDTFIVVLIFGVGTDYAIFLISRFREEVAKGDWHDAARTTVGRIGAVISASAATVIVGLGSMAVGDFGMIQTTGPALAIGIAVTLVAGLTLTPALLGIFGHYLFWPRHTHAPGEGRGRRVLRPARRRRLAPPRQRHGRAPRRRSSSRRSSCPRCGPTSTSSPSCRRPPTRGPASTPLPSTSDAARCSRGPGSSTAGRAPTSSSRPRSPASSA